MYRIQEMPEVMADACLRDSEGRFMFLSIYGRDTAVMQFLAAMELPRDKQGIEMFSLIDTHTSLSSTVDVGGTDRLTKHSGRLPRGGLFGPLSHMWIYHAGLTEPDMVNRSGWVLHHGAYDERALAERSWRLLQRLSPVPLLDAWRDCLMDHARATGMVRELNDPLYPPLGPISGARVGIGQEFLAQLSDLVQRGVLTLHQDMLETA